MGGQAKDRLDIIALEKDDGETPMTDSTIPQEPISEELVLQRIAQWEANRAFWIQMLKENPYLVARLDERTRVNLGFDKAVE